MRAGVVVRFTLICSSLACLSANAQSLSSYPLFADDSVLELKISGPFQDIFRSTDEETEFEVAVEYIDAAGASVTVPAEVRQRGRFRRENCEFLPPLRLNFPRSQMDGTVFEGQNNLKLVNQCGRSSLFKDYLLSEYLIYRTLNLLTGRSFRVRRLNIEYVYTDTRKPRSVIAPAFLIEDDGALAERLGLEVAEVDGIGRASLDPDYTALVHLFQYLIGNTDWSVLRGAEGDHCCHNGQPLRSADGRFFVVPYDFDFAGLIDATYAAPPENLSIGSVRQRLYRGFCVLDPQLDTAIALVDSHRDEIIGLFDSELLSNGTRKSAVSYIGDFFAVIDDPEEREEQLDEKCRS